VVSIEALSRASTLENRLLTLFKVCKLVHYHSDSESLPTITSTPTYYQDRIYIDVPLSELGRDSFFIPLFNSVVKIVRLHRLHRNVFSKPISLVKAVYIGKLSVSIVVDSSEETSEVRLRCVLDPYWYTFVETSSTNHVSLYVVATTLARLSS